MRALRNLFLAVLATAMIVSIPFAVEAGGKKYSGEIKADGSSTVGPITLAMGNEFKKLHPKVSVSVGISGTGGGFQKFAKGETDISNASRPIKPAEAEACTKNGIEYLELKVGLDGLAVILHKDNKWASKMTIEQLKKIWHPDIAAKTWKDVDPSWPDEKIDLYGAGTQSGTFDYFTEVINGKEKVSRTDYKGSENDNDTIQGVSKSKYAMGYLGVAYYEAHKDELGVVAIAKKSGDPFVLPVANAVLTGKYPLSRPLFIYAKKSSLKQDHIKAYVEFYLGRADIVSKVKYVPLSPINQLKEKKRFDEYVTAL